MCGCRRCRPDRVRRPASSQGGDLLRYPHCSANRRRAYSWAVRRELGRLGRAVILFSGQCSWTGTARPQGGAAPLRTFGHSCGLRVETKVGLRPPVDLVAVPDLQYEGSQGVTFHLKDNAVVPDTKPEQPFLSAEGFHSPRPRVVGQGSIRGLRRRDTSGARARKSRSALGAKMMG